MRFSSSLMKKLLQRYRKMSIQMVISFSFTAVTVVGMVFIGLSLLLRFSAATDLLLQDNSQRILSQVNMNLDSYLRRMMRISDAVYYRGIKNTDFAKGDIEDALSLLYAENRDSLVSIAAFDSQGILISSVPLTTLKPNVAPGNEQWFKEALEKMENFHFSPPHVQNLFQNPDYTFRWVISLGRQIELTRNGVTENGVLLVDMSYGGIEQICREADLSNKGYLYLMDSNGEIIYHPQQQLIHAGLVQENNFIAAGYRDGVHKEKYNGATRQVMVKTVGYTGWKLVGIVPVEGLESNSQQMLIFGVFLLLFAVFLMSYLNFRISAYISDPIRKLEKYVKDFEAGVSEIGLVEGGCYEVEQLNNAIHSMISTMRYLMDDIVKQEMQKRRSELEVLQSQINPHFLYNTLDSVVWMTEAGRYNESIQMVTSLARLFRIVLSKGKSIIPLAEEIEHAKHYMTIQGLRYKNRFETQIRVGEGTEKLYVLKLIIQPLLENAVYHGLPMGQEDGIISVMTYFEGGDLIIDVADNGLGMRPEIVEKLLDESQPQVSANGSGIGFRNVHRRIQLAFGMKYGLSILSEPDEGTTVRIKMPALKEADILRYQPEDE